MPEGRSPHGECGLKYDPEGQPLAPSASLPAWGVWIEIIRHNPRRAWRKSLPAWGVWIEIAAIITRLLATPSLPAWGVWIEIIVSLRQNQPTPSLPAWGVWIEIGKLLAKMTSLVGSLPAWGVWIEIGSSTNTLISNLVAPRMGSVD